MNKAMMTGRLTADAVARYTKEQKPVWSARFAVKRHRPTEGQPDADFFTLSAFGKTAETMIKCDIKKGTKLLIEGTVQNNRYTDRNGVSRDETQVVVTFFEFLESKTQKGEYDASNAKFTPTNEQSPFPDIDDMAEQDSLPF